MFNIIEKRLKEIGKNQKWLAEQSGIPPNYFTDWKNLKRHPSGQVPGKHLFKVAKALGVTPNYLYGLDSTVDNSIVEAYKIHFYDLSASMGAGTQIVEEPSQEYLVVEKGGFLEHHGLNHFKPRDLMMITVKGDSMLPTIASEDLCICVKGEFKTSDGIYLIRTNQGLMVKRLQTIANKVWVISDNKTYKDWHADDSVTILAKVIRIWNSKTI